MDEMSGILRDVKSAPFEVVLAAGSRDKKSSLVEEHLARAQESLYRRAGYSSLADFDEEVVRALRKANLMGQGVPITLLTLTKPMIDAGTRTVDQKIIRRNLWAQHVICKYVAAGNAQVAYRSTLVHFVDIYPFSLRLYSGGELLRLRGQQHGEGERDGRRELLFREETRAQWFQNRLSQLTGNRFRVDDIRQNWQ